MARAARTLELSDGEPRQVRFTFGALDRLRQQTGIELDDFRDRAKMAKLVTRHLPVMIWAALTAQYRAQLSPEDISDLIDFQDLPRITEQLMSALSGGPENPMTAASEPEAAADTDSLSTDAALLPESTLASVTVISGA